MAARGKLGNLGEPSVSLLILPEEEGYRLTKSPGAGGELPTLSEPATGHKGRKRTRYGAASDKRSDLRRAQGSRSQADYRRRWGSEAQATHRREGEAGQSAWPGGETGRTSSLPTV